MILHQYKEFDFLVQVIWGVNINYYEKLDHWIMQFESFHWLSHHGMSHCTMIDKNGERMRDFLGLFVFIVV